jgi:hypothetical protein
MQPEGFVIPEISHHNYCRNPDNSDQPWCYVEGADEGTRENCIIEKCEDMEKLEFTFESAVTQNLEGYLI